MKQRLTKKNREDVFKRYGQKCFICETTSNLEIAHLVSLNQGGTNEIENLRPICPICHSILDKTSFREFEFEKYLAQLISNNQKFSKTLVEKEIGNELRKRVDIYTEKGANKYNIEVKAITYLSRSQTKQIISQVQRYAEEGTKLIFAFPGIANEETVSKFEKHNISVWDIPKVVELFSDEIHDVEHPFFKPLYLSHSKESIELNLIQKLNDIDPGRKEWSLYQKLLNDILERLFCPPLEKPIYELSDSFKINRRDYILPNYCEDGFWLYLRSQYQADFIVIDAKNYTSNIKKKDILQISNYLKAHGAGRFGIIVTRKGEERSSRLTRREVWAIEKKLIIVITDEDIEQMLMLKSVGNQPEKIIKDRIQEFRLSL